MQYLNDKDTVNFYSNKKNIHTCQLPSTDNWTLILTEANCATKYLKI